MEGLIAGWRMTRESETVPDIDSTNNASHREKLTGDSSTEEETKRKSTRLKVKLYKLFHFVNKINLCISFAMFRAVKRRKWKMFRKNL